MIITSMEHANAKLRPSTKFRKVRVGQLDVLFVVFPGLIQRSEQYANGVREDIGTVDEERNYVNMTT